MQRSPYPSSQKQSDTNSYLTLLERSMEKFQIKKCKLPSISQYQITGKIMKVFVELPAEEAREYDFVKEAILNLFSLSLRPIE